MNIGDALKPSPMLLCLLGSIVVHAEELLSPDGHAFDKITAAAREAARPKIGHKRGCVTINCLGCGSDFFSTDCR